MIRCTFQCTNGEVKDCTALCNLVLPIPPPRYVQYICMILYNTDRAYFLKNIVESLWNDSNSSIRDIPNAYTMLRWPSAPRLFPQLQPLLLASTTRCSKWSGMQLVSRREQSIISATIWPKTNMEMVLTTGILHMEDELCWKGPFPFDSLVKFPFLLRLWSICYVNC